jgi:hypothetical protein
MPVGGERIFESRVLREYVDIRDRLFKSIVRVIRSGRLKWAR